MRIAISHPGKIGDLLFTLPTARYLSEQHGCQVDVYTSPYCRGAIDLIAFQPYVGRAVVLEEYVMEHFLCGAQPWRMPVPEDQYDLVYQLGFRAFPDRHCVGYVAHIVGLPEPDPESFQLAVPDTGVVDRLGLKRPFVLVTTSSVTGGGGLTWDWSNDKVSEFVRASPLPVYAVGLDEELRRYKCYGRFTPLTGLSLVEIAQIMKAAQVVVTFSTGLGVLASGVLNGTGVRLVCLFDGEIGWDIFKLPGALTCSPDEDLAAIAFGTRAPRDLERAVAALERERREASRRHAAAVGALEVEAAHYLASISGLLRTQTDPAAPDTWPAGGGPHVLVITDACPTPDQDSGSFRLVQILRLLRELDFRVTLAFERREGDQKYVDDIYATGAAVVTGQAGIEAHLALDGHRYRFVVVSRPEVAFRYLLPVRAHCAGATVLYDTVDLHWVRLRRAAELSGDAELARRADEYRRMETFNAAASDIVLAITEQEKSALLDMDAAISVAVLPNVHPRASTGGPWSSRRDLMFIGGFWHEPNVDAVCHFAEDVMPLVRRELPDVVFRIVGSNMPDRVKALASATVEPLGYVEDPASIFDASRVFVAPLRYGAGMKGKIGHAMTHGLPVVTTSVGAEGMQLVEGETALIADGAEAFARAVVRLYTDEPLWQRLAERSAAHVDALFSEAATRRRLADLLGVGRREASGPAV